MKIKPRTCPVLSFSGDRAFSQCCIPHSLVRWLVVAEPTPPARGWKLDAPEALQRPDEGIHTLASRRDASLGGDA
jgi:hypothetical protein